MDTRANVNHMMAVAMCDPVISGPMIGGTMLLNICSIGCA